jgi:hypothetical protein
MVKENEREMIKEFLKTFLSSLKRDPNSDGYLLDRNKIEKFLTKYFPEKPLASTYAVLHDLISKYPDIFQLYGISVGKYGELYYNNIYTVIE